MSFALPLTILGLFKRDLECADIGLRVVFNKDDFGETTLCTRGVDCLLWEFWTFFLDRTLELVSSGGGLFILLAEETRFFGILGTAARKFDFIH